MLTGGGISDFEILTQSSLEKPEVSVVVPIYNKEENNLLKECLDSLVSQDLKTIEIICVDDASTDNSLKIALEYANHYNNITVLAMKENKRQGTARNRGIAIAEGEYIGLVDADDLVSEQLYSSLLAEARKSGATMVEAPVQSIDLDGNPRGIPALGTPMDCLGITDDSKIAKLINEHARAFSCIYKSIFLQRRDNFYPEGMLYEDTPTFIRWLYSLDSISQIDSPCYLFRLNPDSTTHTTANNKDAINDRLMSADMIINDAREFGVYDKYKAALDRYYLQVYYFNTLGMLIAEVDKLDPSFLRYMKHHAEDKIGNLWQAVDKEALSTRKSSIAHWMMINTPVLFARLKRAKNKLQSKR